jgi:hypothetical protein
MQRLHASQARCAPRGTPLAALAFALCAAGCPALGAETAAETAADAARPAIAASTAAPPVKPARPGQSGREQKPAERWLWLEVRDTPPPAGPAYRRAADGSVTISTGGSLQDGSLGNGSVVGTAAPARRLRVREGEPLRVDLPATQGLQVRVPVVGRNGAGAVTPGSVAAAGAASSTASGAASGSTAGTAGSAAGGTSSGAAASGASGAAYGQVPQAEAVIEWTGTAAFLARFRLAGAGVEVELQPLAAGVSAPVDHVSGTRRTPVRIMGPLGAWMALAEPGLSERSLSPYPDAPPSAGVWVRVTPEQGAP